MKEEQFGSKMSMSKKKKSLAEKRQAYMEAQDSDEGQDQRYYRWSFIYFR